MKKYFNETKLLIKSVPTLMLVMFILTIFSMNLLANKSIVLPVEWLALDCGMLISWFAFLTMDILTNHFGPKAATELSIFAICINLIMCLVFYLTSIIPGIWGQAYVDGYEDIINTALNNTFGGTWYVILGSTIAFVASAFINNFTNYGIGKIIKGEGKSFKVYITRAYISTAIGQFADNLVFSLLVSKVFFGWTLIQCITCAITGVLIELACEIIFSKLGYKVCVKWEKENVGREYIELQKKKGVLV